MIQSLRVWMIGKHPADSKGGIEDLLAESENACRLPGFQVEDIPDFSAGMDRLAEDPASVCLLSLSSPDDLQQLSEVHTRNPDVPVIVCVDHEHESIGLLALAQGAVEYLFQDPFEACSVASAFRHALTSLRLVASQRRLHWLEANSSEVIWRADLELHFLEISPAIQVLAGFSVEDALGTTLHDCVSRESQPVLENALHALPYPADQEDHDWSPVFEVQHLRNDGSTFWAEIALKPILGADGQQEGWEGVTRDITSRHNLQEKLDYLSLHDPLTGLFNRAYFLEELKRLEFSRLYPITIVTAELDSLKTINLNQGIEAGDDLIKRTAQLLRAIFRAEDMLARVGGGGFVAIMPHCSSRAAARVLQRVINLVEGVNAEQPDMPINLSLGIATAEQGHSLSDTVRLASPQISNA